MFIEILSNVVINTDYIVSTEIKASALPNSDARVLFVHMTNGKTYSVYNYDVTFSKLFETLGVVPHRFLQNINI